MEILNIYPNPERSEWAALTERCTRREEEITRQVASILDEVRTGGDRALRDITRRIEGRDCETFEVPADVRRAAAALIPEALKEALDTAKAVANLLTNPGKAEDYQGWELVKSPAVYKIGIPTLSGTGSECSRTCVLTNIPKNLKLGMNSDYTVYDQLLLDPDLLATVPRDQYFYTGIDTFMHCVESLQGSYRNAIIDAFSVRAVQLCEEIFLSDDMMSE